MYMTDDNLPNPYDTVPSYFGNLVAELDSSAPHNLQATAGIGNVTLSWQAPSSNGGSPITNYKIYRSSTSGTEGLLTTVGNVTSYNDTGLASGHTYFYKVTAVNSIGTSPQSNEASATTLTMPSAPQNLQATPRNSNLTLSWQAPSSNGGSPITNYKIYRSSTSGTEGLLTTVGNVTSYTNTGLASGHTYFYKVTAVNSIGTSPQSNEASATTLTMPSAPQNLQATAGIRNVTLSWQAPSSNGGSPITNYKIYRSTSSGTETLLTTVGNVTSYTNTGLASGHTYFYKVAAVNGIGTSPQSNEASAAPSTTATQAISLNPLTGPAGTTVTVTGTNFSSNSPITAVTYDGTTVITNPAIIQTDSSGGFSATFAVPSPSNPGSHTVNAT